MGIIVIKAGREKSLHRRHPWIFSGAIARVLDKPAAGDIVTVVNERDEFLARGYWNAASQIQVRVLTWHDEDIDADWWRQRLRRAIDARALFNAHADTSAYGYRLVNAENDYLPGLIVDRYADVLVLQALTFAIDQRKTLLAELLAELTGAKTVYERSDVDVRRKEGLPQTVGLLWGEEPPAQIIITENGVKIAVDVRHGHKTGFYLDQAENRSLLYKLVSEDFSFPDGDTSSVLNLFSYTGGFALHAMRFGGLHTVNVDSSHEALVQAETNVALNGFDAGSHTAIQADVFQYLRDAAARGEQHDIVVLDPPKFAHTQQQIDKAARGYKDINLNAFKLVKPGGYLLTFSCSGAITRDLFQKIVFGALEDSGREAQIVRHLSQSADHPIALTFPEGEYLKGLLLRVY